MTPVISVSRDARGEDLTGAKFGDLTDRVIVGCKLNNTEWPARMSRVHIHDCTGATPKMVITVCWFCGRFTDETEYARAVYHAFNVTPLEGPRPRVR